MKVHLLLKFLVELIKDCTCEAERKPMDCSKSEILVRESLNQPFYQHHSAEHYRSSPQYLSTDLDDLVASVFFPFTAVDYIDDDDSGGSGDTSCRYAYPTDSILSTKPSEYHVYDKHSDSVCQNQHNARQNVCENLIEDRFSFLIHRLFLRYRI